MNALTITLLSALTTTLFAQEPGKTGKPAAGGEQAPAAAKVLQLGQRANGMTTLTDIDGNAQKAHDLMGKVTVVNFFSIKCPIQADWDQRLAQIQKDFEGQGVVFLHVDSNVSEIGEAPQKAEGDKKPYAEIRDHLKAKSLPFRVLADHGNKVADMFDAKTTPHVYVFAADGKLVYKGLVDDDQKDKNADKRQNHLRDVLGKLTKGEKVEPFSTKEQGCSIKRMKGTAAPAPASAPAGDGKKGGS